MLGTDWLERTLDAEINAEFGEFGEFGEFLDALRAIEMPTSREFCQTAHIRFGTES